MLDRTEDAYDRFCSLAAPANVLDVDLAAYAVAAAGEVAAELVQVAADGVPPVSLAEHLAQPVALAQPGSGNKNMADRDRPAEHRGGILAHRIVGEGDDVDHSGDSDSTGAIAGNLLGASRSYRADGEVMRSGAARGERRLAWGRRRRRVDAGSRRSS